MPIFPYVCESCKVRLEVLEPFGSNITHYCPECKSTLVRYIGTANGMLYRPDKDKILNTMKVNHRIVE